jgi:hypothetical protein
MPSILLPISSDPPLLPFSLSAEAVDDGGNSQPTGDWKLHAETSFVDMLVTVSLITE